METIWQEIKNKSIKTPPPSKESIEKNNKNDEKIINLQNDVDKLFKEKEHGARSWLTTCFLVGLFLLIILSAIYVIKYNQSVIEMVVTAKKEGIDIKPESIKFLSFDTVFSLIINSFGTSLGFIIGYYFKDKANHK